MLILTDKLLTLSKFAKGIENSKEVCYNIFNKSTEPLQ